MRSLYTHRFNLINTVFQGIEEDGCHNKMHGPNSTENRSERLLVRHKAVPQLQPVSWILRNEDGITARRRCGDISDKDKSWRTLRPRGDAQAAEHRNVHVGMPKSGKAGLSA